MSATPSSSDARALPRVVGLPGALLLGLGSILGTGVFVGLALAAQQAGALIVPALLLAGLLATCNGLSSAALAARFPVSGGTYEYGYRLLSPSLGFAAGWLFLCAKCASFAGAALGASAYLTTLLGIADPLTRKITAVGLILLLTALTSAGLKKSHRVNVAMVGATLAGLAVFVLVALAEGAQTGIAPDAWSVPGDDHGRRLLQAAAFLFVAFTGYGRIATLGEEIRDPARNVPRAVVITLAVSLAVYLGVALSGLAAVGASAFGHAADGRAPPAPRATAAAPLETDATRPETGAGATTSGAAQPGVDTRLRLTPPASDGAALTAVVRGLGHPFLAAFVALASIAAMLGVALNLSLGLSRVVLAMARRGDLPDRLASLGAHGTSPVAATVAVGLVAAVLAAFLTVKTSWSFSAFTVLVYYAITNLAALRLGETRRRPTAVVGLLACLALAVWVDGAALLAGVATLAAGFVLRAAFRRWRNPRASL